MTDHRARARAQEAAWDVRMSDPADFERRVTELDEATTAGLPTPSTSLPTTRSDGEPLPAYPGADLRRDPVTAFLRARLELAHGRLEEALLGCRDAESRLPEDSVWRARLLETQGNVLDSLGLYDEALDNLTRADECYRRIGDLRGQATTRQNIGAMGFQTAAQALDHFRAALKLAKQAEADDVTGVILANTAEMEHRLGHPTEGVRARLEEALALLEPTWPAGALDTRFQLLSLALEEQDTERAEQIARETGDPLDFTEPRMRAMAAAALAELARTQGRPQEAARLLRASLDAGVRPDDEPELRHRYARALGEADRPEEGLAQSLRAYEQEREARLEDQMGRVRALDAWFRTALLRQEHLREQQRADALEEALRDLRVATHRIHELSIRDSVTGLHNRQYLMDHATAALRRARPDCPAELALIDLDHFKAVNDTYGHATGDVVLQAFATALRDHLPGSDIVARYGGEEFVVVRPPRPAALPARSLHADLEGLRTVLGALALRSGDGRPLPTVTMSAGVTTITGGGLEAALGRADRTMYLAKATGRDLVLDGGTDDPSPGARSERRDGAI